MKKKRYWTEVERSKVINEYGIKTSAELADELGRTAWSVRCYIKRVNDARKLSRSENWDYKLRVIPNPTPLPTPVPS